MATVAKAVEVMAEAIAEATDVAAEARVELAEATVPSRQTQKVGCRRQRLAVSLGPPSCKPFLCSAV